MSRIGKKPIQIPDKVKVEVKGRTIHVQGPQGVLDAIIPAGVTVEISGSTINIKPPTVDRSNAGFYGLARALIANMVSGVAKGYEKTLEINGVGYKCEQKGNTLVFSLGYTHPCEIELPKGIKAKIDKGTVVTISGPDKQVVGQVAAQIRSFKKPEPYQGKGIKYSTETIRRKVGKTGAK